VIPNYWYAILRTSDLGSRRSVAVTRFGKRLVIWRGRDGHVAGLPDRCSHRGALLSRGRIRDGCIECPYHGLRFNEDGRCVLIPANGAHTAVPSGFDIEPLRLREEHGLIWYWYGNAAPTEDVPWFDDAYEEGDRSYSCAMTVDLPFMRVMENLYDFHHVPFVHRWTAPGFGPCVDFTAEAEGELIRFAASYRYEGRPVWYKPAVSLSALSRLPSMVMFEEVSGVNFHASVTPVDETRSWLWARYHQRFLPGWLGGRWLARLIAAYDFGMVFKKGDVPTMRSQMDPAGNISGYRLFHADRAISLYFAIVKRAMESSMRPHAR
jgi:nitrite reductase/ring-hydroxylating ferredoxin subunit